MILRREIPQSSGFNKERGSEDSHQLEIISWSLRATEDKKMEIEKILKCSLVHGLPEIYTEDIPLYRSDDASLNIKKDREISSTEKKEFLNFSDLHKWIEKHQKQEDNESKLVYVVDQLLPFSPFF